MKIIVTGATGFIGFHVINYLIENTSHDIIGVSRIKKPLDKKNGLASISFIQADIHEEKSNWFEFFGAPDLLIHLAWPNLPNYTENFHLTENLPKDIIFLDNLLTNGLRSLVVVGTCFEYGLQSGVLTEDMPTFPANPYAIAKDTLRRYLEFKTNSYKCRFKWLRLFYMYGEGQHPYSLISQINHALSKGEKQINLSGGEQIRDYLSVSEVAKIISELSLDSQNNGIFNVCSGEPVRLKDFVTQYVKKFEGNINLNFGYYSYSPLEPMEFWGSNLKLKKFLK
jgi:nucleoside-diphosphate-sugar epimerase